MDCFSYLKHAVYFGISFLTVFFASLVVVKAESVPQFFAPIATQQTILQTTLQTSSSDLEPLLNHNPFSIDQTSRHYGEDQPMVEESRLDNAFYEDRDIRIYNNTLYSMDELSNKYRQAQASQVTMSDLYISLGYGMAFNLNKNQSVGYEYISSFPHDRGQSIRLFWKVVF